MKPVLIKKWVDGLFLTRNDTTTDLTTNPTLDRHVPILGETAHSSLSTRLPGGKARLYEAPVSSSSNQGQHPGSADDHHRQQSRGINPHHRHHPRSTRKKEPKVQPQDTQVKGSEALHHEVLLGSTPLDSHIVSDFITQTMSDHAIPPQLNLRLHDYEFCDLLWLRPNLDGQNVSGARHPYHHTHYDSTGATTRSLVVFIAAVCLPEVPEEHQYFKPAGIGVFFNKYSELNVSDSFDMTHRLEASRSGARGLMPHLEAARNALLAVRTEIVPDRIQIIRDVGVRYGWAEVDVQAVARFHLIVATDSQALLDEISSWSSSNHLRRALDVGSSGDRDALVDLLDQIEALSRQGIQVVWSLVNERWNRPAQKLAADAVIKYCSRLDGQKPWRITGSLQFQKRKTREIDRGESRNPFVKFPRRLPDYGYLGSFWGYRGL
jgi:hypothetical protein